MATKETIVDQKQVDLSPPDPNVIIPRHVREAAERAEAIHKASYTEPTAPIAASAPEPEPVPDANRIPNSATQQPAQPVEPAQVSTSPVHDGITSDYTAPATPNELRDNEWVGRYNSMRGRWEASQRQMGEMRSQMDMLAQELQRSQELLQARNERNEPTTNSDVHHENLITPEERDTYGDDLINVARKAAVETLKPELDAIRGENAQLRKQVVHSAQRELKIALAGAVPNWQAINVHPSFLNWLRLPNIYTGQLRQQMLNAAYKAADAPKVIAIFQDYVRDTIATGGVLPGTQAEQPTAQAPAPRQAAVPLESIAAPGRARPASGDTSQSAPVDKPTYTRAWISNFYRDVRRGVYRGRETEQARIEDDLGRAQYEGRVRG